MAKKKSISQMAREAGIAPSVVHQRIKTGWTLEKALNTPVRKRKPKVADGGDWLPPDDHAIYPPQYRAVVEELEKAQAELAFGAKRCKLISLTLSVLVALMAAVVIVE